MKRRDFLSIAGATLIGITSGQALAAGQGRMTGSNAFNPAGKISQGRSGDLKTAQEFTLTSLISQFTDRNHAGWMVNQVWQNGHKFSELCKRGECPWSVPLSFAYNPSMQWLAQSHDSLLIASEWQYYRNRGMNMNGLLEALQRHDPSVRSGEYMNQTIIAGTWYSMVFASASTTFASKLSGIVAQNLSGRTFETAIDARQAVANTLASIGDYQLDQMFITCLRDAENDSYIPHLSTPDFKPTNTLTEFQTAKRGVFRFGAGGWEILNGTVMFGPAEGLIDGVVHKISITDGRSTGITFEGMGRK